MAVIMKIMGFIPLEAQKIALVLLLSFLVGLEREEHKQNEKSGFSFGGIHTFPLLGILGYTLALLSPQQPLTLGIGLLVVGAFMVMSFRYKLSQSPAAGITTEVSALVTFLLGAVVYFEHYWIATTIVVVGVLLLELKLGLESMARRTPPEEVLTFTKFLLLTAVILPILPNEPMTAFQINPFKAWLIVVAISSLSYASYILQKFIGARGTFLSAIIGGAYSSTAATVALSKRSKSEQAPHLYSGAILAASGVMYLRLAVLITVFNAELRDKLALAFCALGAAALGAGYLWSRKTDRGRQKLKDAYGEKNPLEISSAILFGLLFLLMLVATKVVLQHFGAGGIYGLATLTGVTDVDPFIMGLTQSAGGTTPVSLALAGIVIAAASNNAAKAAYAYALSDRATGKKSAVLLAFLSVAGLVPLFLLA